MEPFLLSFITITLAEFGDKSQLITLYLAGKQYRISQMLFGMIAASLLNHYVAAWAGAALYEWFSPTLLQGTAAVAFLLIAVFSWKHQDVHELTVFQKKMPPLFACFLFYFVAEAADKTQIATAALAAYHHTVWVVVCGATLGMVLANIPVLYLGRQFGNRVPLKTLKKCTAVLFAGVGIFMLVSVFV